MGIAVMPEDARPSTTPEILRRRQSPCLVVVDRECRVLIAEPRLPGFLAEAGAPAMCFGRLPEAIEAAIRRCAVLAGEAGAAAVQIVPGCDLAVRASLLAGSSGHCIAVSLERLRARDPIRSASRRYGLSHRESEVLQLALQGLEAREIAVHLTIAESTVGEYFKHLYLKIGVKNRSAMIARVFGCAPEARV